MFTIKMDAMVIPVPVGSNPTKVYTAWGRKVTNAINYEATDVIQQFLLDSGLWHQVRATRFMVYLDNSHPYTAGITYASESFMVSDRDIIQIEKVEI